MERRKRFQSRVSLVVALTLTGGLFYSMLTWMPASAATFQIGATFGGGFEPQEITIAPTDDLTWTNNDSAGSGLTHNLVADGLTPLDQGFTEACEIEPGESCSPMLNAIPNPNGYPYHCSIHPSMEGIFYIDLEADPTDPPASESPSPSTTTTPSGSPPPSQSPSPSPSVSETPTPTPTPDPTNVPRTVTLNLKRHLIAKGKVEAPTDLTGACIEGVEVAIQKKKKRQPGWKTLNETATTDADGKYSMDIPDKQGKYRAKIEPGTPTPLLICSAAKSEPDRHKHNNNRARR